MAHEVRADIDAILEKAMIGEPRNMQQAIGPSEIPYGYCGCGCGEKTWIATRNKADRGWVKGEPVQYRGGHNGRVSPSRWHGDGINYGSAHDRVRSAMGSASEYTCRNCGNTAEEWAYDHGDPNEKVDRPSGSPYSTDVNHYMPLCVLCHRAFDARPLATQCSRGHEWTEETTWIFKGNGKRRCRICHRDNERERNRRKREEAKAA